MASNARAFRALSSADPVPASGRDFVRYAGGRTAAVRALSGMAGTPRRADYRTDDAYAEARRHWRSASRRVQRWDTETGAERRERAKLTPTEKRRAQKVNRDRKRDAVRRNGIRVRIQGLVAVPSAGKRGEPARDRVLPVEGSPAVELDLGDELLDTMREYGYEAALEHVMESFFDEYGMPYAQVDNARVKVWPAGEREPGW